jgi:hypothetical protein
MVTTVAGALLATAAATVLIDGGFTDSTPHGQLLGVLREVSTAQEAEYARTGEFARWLHTLDVTTPEEIQLSLIRVDNGGWEVVASHRDVNLSCSQSGGVEAGRATLSSPVCFTRLTD